jgi:uncharacterized protein with HEPN domain
VRKYPEPYILLAERALDRLESYVPECEAAFLQQPVLQDAILLQALQIGENLSQLRSRFPDQYKRAPESWNQIVGLRNTIAHGYERVNLSDVWRYLVEDLDELRASLVAARTEGWFELSSYES